MTERINELNRGIISDIQLVPNKKFDSLDNQVNWNKYTAKDSVMFTTLEGDTLYGIGFESDADLEEWRIFQPYGIVREGI